MNYKIFYFPLKQIKMKTINRTYDYFQKEIEFLFSQITALNLQIQLLKLM